MLFMQVQLYCQLTFLEMKRRKIAGNIEKWLSLWYANRAAND